MCCGVSSPNSLAEWMMAGLLLVKAIILVGAAGWLIPRLWRFGICLAGELKTSALVSEAYAGLAEEDALSLIDDISRLGNGKPRGCILMRGPTAIATGAFVALPPGDIPDFPWSGKRITAEYLGRAAECPVSFRIDNPREGELEQSTDLGTFKPPFVRSSSKKAQHVFSAASYIRMSRDLETRLTALCPEAPLQLLEKVLRKHGIGEDSIRVGLNPVWVQGWRSHKCRECGKPLRLIIQLPGAAIDSKVAEGVFYLFGCTRHPEITTTDQDWY